MQQSPVSQSMGQRNASKNKPLSTTLRTSINEGIISLVANDSKFTKLEDFLKT
jgi:hypothetical protein